MIYRALIDADDEPAGESVKFRQRAIGRSPAPEYSLTAKRQKPQCE